MKRLFTMKKHTILAILAFPLIFMPGLITGLLNDIVFKPTAWWGFNLIYAIACLLSIVLLWFILKKCGYSMRDIGLSGFKANHVGWAILFSFVGFCFGMLYPFYCSNLELRLDGDMKLVSQQDMK